MTTPILTALLSAGMTHGQAKAAFTACWPDLRLGLYWPTAAFYKEDSRAEDAQTEDHDVLRAQGAADTVVVTGNLTEAQCRDMIYRTFHLETEIHYSHGWYVRGETIHERQEIVSRWRAEFEARHGHSPGPRDRID